MRNRGILDLEAVNAQNRPFLTATDPLSLQRGSGVWKTRQQTQSEKTLVKTRAHARARVSVRIRRFRATSIGGCDPVSIEI